MIPNVPMRLCPKHFLNMHVNNITIYRPIGQPFGRKTAASAQYSETYVQTEKLIRIKSLHTPDPKRLSGSPSFKENEFMRKETKYNEA